MESRQSGIKTKVLTIGFLKNDSANYERLAKLVQGLPFLIMINNVWKSPDIPILLWEMSGTEMEDIITINVNGTLEVTQIVTAGWAS